MATTLTPFFLLLRPLLSLSLIQTLLRLCSNVYFIINGNNRKNLIIQPLPPLPLPTNERTRYERKPTMNGHEEKSRRRRKRRI